MKAVVVPDVVDGSINVTDVPVPEVGHGQALVKLEYSGVCHTDLHVAAGDFGKVPGARPGGMRVLVLSPKLVKALNRSSPVTVSLLHGSSRDAGTANTAPPAGRPYAVPSRMRATPWTVP